MSLKKDLAKGVLWTSIAKYSGIVVSLVISAVLSRLLTPADFGTVGAATVLITFFNILGDIGIGPAVIQRSNLDKKDISSIFSLTIYLGFILGIIFFTLSWPIAYFYEDPSIIPICQLLSLTILFNCARIVPTNLQYKNQKFKEIGIITLIVQITVGIISIAYAFLGGGVYALVSSNLLSSLILTIIYLKIGRIPFTCKLSKTSIDKIKNFSLYQFLFNCVNYFSRNLDNILIGRFMGMAQLGYYEKSYRLMMLPLQNITFVITPVLLPVFSKHSSSRKEMGEQYIKLLSFLSYISFPISIVLFFCGKDLILLIFGDQWGPSVWPFQILSLTVSLQIINSTTGSIYQAADATKQLFWSGMICALILITSFLITIILFKSLEAVCWGFNIAILLCVLVSMGILFNILFINLKQSINIILKPILITGILFGVLFLIQPFCMNLNLILSLTFKILISLIIFLILFQLFSPISLIKIVKTRGAAFIN